MLHIRRHWPAEADGYEVDLMQLSTRARRELAIMHAGDAIRVLAAAAIPLHVLPFGGILLSILTASFPWLGFFLAWSVAQIVLHLTLLRAADGLLEETRKNFLLALSAGLVFILLSAASQIIVSGLLGVGFFLVILITCGLFDILASGALLYVFWATYRALFGRLEDDQDRHFGFEVVLPEAQAAHVPRSPE
jgi:hypothetical protein